MIQANLESTDRNHSRSGLGEKPLDPWTPKIILGPRLNYPVAQLWEHHHYWGAGMPVAADEAAVIATIIIEVG